MIYFITGESISVKEEAKLPKLTTCKRCNYVSSQETCKACILLEGLNRGLPRLGIGKSSKIKKMLTANTTAASNCQCSETKCCSRAKDETKTEVQLV